MPRNGLTEGRLVLLFGVGCAAILISMFVLFSSAEVRSAIWHRDSEFRVASGFDARNDPPVGIKVALPRTDFRGAKLSVGGSGFTLLVLCGECSECSIGGVKNLDIDVSRYSNVVLLYKGEEAELRRSCGKLPKEYKIVYDRGGVLHKLLNGVFAPRYVLADAGLRIAALQTDPDKVPSFVQVKR